MSSPNNSISIVVSAQDQASATLSKVRTEIQQTGNTSDEAAPKTDRFGSTLGTLASRVRFVAETFAIYGVARTLTEFASSSLQAAGQLEQTNIAFQSLIGNTAEANKVFGELVQYANLTPFQSKDIVQAAQTLMGFGTAGQQTVDVLKQLGDVVSVGGGNLQQLSLVTGQIFAQGKLRAQDMYQVINDGGAGLVKIMAANAGGMSKLTAQFDAGGVSAQEYFQALSQATGQGGFAFQGANREAQTFQGRVSTLKDTVTQFGMALLGVHIDPQLGYEVDRGGLFDRISSGVQSVNDKLTGLAPQMRTVVPEMLTRFGALSSEISQFVGPAFAGLGATVSTQLMPALGNLWHNVLEPLVPVLGGTFLVAVRASVDILNDLLKVITPVLDFMSSHSGVVYGLAAAFTALKVEMALGAAFDAVKIAIATFQLITIPSLQASIAAVGASWEVSAAKAAVAWTVNAAKVVAETTVTAARMVASAAVASASWVANAAVVTASAMASAARVTAAWVAASVAWIASSARAAAAAVADAALAAGAWIVAAHNSEDGFIGSLARMAIESTERALQFVVDAATAGAAWVANAATAAYAWVTVQLPRIVAGFVTTAASATRNAVVASAVWVKQAAVSSFAWVTTELPRIVIGFATTAAAASRNAVISGSVWAAGAVVASAAWLLQMARIVAAYVASTVQAVINAAAQAASWVAASAAAGGYVIAIEGARSALAIFDALAAAPLVMGAIDVTAALADIYLVYQAVQSVQGAIKAVNDTANAAKADAAGQQAAEQSIINSFKAGKISKAMEVKLLTGIAQPAHALGTDFAPGGLSLVGERGPELVQLPRGSKVADSRQTSQMLGGGKTVHIEHLEVNNNLDVSRVLRDIGWRLATA